MDGSGHSSSAQRTDGRLEPVSVCSATAVVPDELATCARRAEPKREDDLRRLTRHNRYAVVCIASYGDAARDCEPQDCGVRGKALARRTVHPRRGRTRTNHDWGSARAFSGAIPASWRSRVPCRAADAICIGPVRVRSDTRPDRSAPTPAASRPGGSDMLRAETRSRPRACPEAGRARLRGRASRRRPERHKASATAPQPAMNAQCPPRERRSRHSAPTTKRYLPSSTIGAAEAAIAASGSRLSPAGSRSSPVSGRTDEGAGMPLPSRSPISIARPTGSARSPFSRTPAAHQVGRGSSQSTLL